MDLELCCFPRFPGGYFSARCTQIQGARRSTVSLNPVGDAHADALRRRQQKNLIIVFWRWLLGLFAFSATETIQVPSAAAIWHDPSVLPLSATIALPRLRACQSSVICGLRGFAIALYCQLQMSCTGMKFAVEMIIKASLLNARIGEVPVTLSCTGAAK